MPQNFRNYLTITAGYWAFTITDGAIRMLVLLYFHQLGYSPLEIALLFLLYELCGVITNLIGGWLGTNIGLNKTMHIGMMIQIGALLMLTVPDAWLSVPYVMMAQAFSGIAKDLNKMSAKAGVKLFLPDGDEAQLFKWVAVLTGSKNSLKGAGFFIGAALLTWLGFRGALYALAGLLAFALVLTWFYLPKEMGKAKSKTKFSRIFSNKPEINWISAARFFLFGARDIWFVVALPVFLQSVLQWSFNQTGAFLALWIIGYGLIQSIAPKLLRSMSANQVGAHTLIIWAAALLLSPALMISGLNMSWNPEFTIMAGLGLFGILFAMNSATHSYLIVSWSDHDKVAMNVGFYYMANAAGRLIGTVLSGLIYQQSGLEGCLYASGVFIFIAMLTSIKLQRITSTNETAKI